MMVTPAEEEVDTEVRREDQNCINKFARLNARLHELREERKIVKVCVCICMFLCVMCACVHGYPIVCFRFHFLIFL
jgi:hypothetical protein